MDIHLGRRSIFLILFGIVFLIFGVTLLGHPTDAPQSLPHIRQHTPLWIQEGISIPWSLAGCIALVTGLTRPKHEWYGFTALYLMAGFWSSLYVIECLIGGWPRAVAGVLVWGLVVGVILLIAGWPDPDQGLIDAERSHIDEIQRRAGEIGEHDEGST